MIRIVCPHCHAPMATHELEQATINGHSCLICPECASVLVSEPVSYEDSHSLEEHFSEPTAVHA